MLKPGEIRDFRFSCNVFALRERREAFGVSLITVHEPCMAAFGPVIGRLRGAGRR